MLEGVSCESWVRHRIPPRSHRHLPAFRWTSARGSHWVTILDGSVIVRWIVALIFTLDVIMLRAVLLHQGPR